MPLFGKRRAKDFERTVRQLQANLEAKFSTTEENGEKSGHSFIHPADIEGVLSRKTVQELFEHLPWFEKNHDELWHHMRVILCILISIGWYSWEQWKQFPEAFFNGRAKVKNARFVDADLPIPAAAIPKFSSIDDLRRFEPQQYIFAPVVIRQGSHQQYSKSCRLPILKTENLDAAGAQGVVEKVTIEAKFLLYVNGTSFTSNTRPQVMAFKRIEANTEKGKHDFQTEQIVLDQFRKSISANQNIMQSFASFLHDSHLVIVSPWAAGRDLNLFLRTPEKIFDDYTQRSIRFSPDNLLTEANNLARALKFLHFELLNGRSRSIRCAHLDLKPENVLVELLADEKEAPVGRWKISDFGLSKVEEAVTENQIMPVGRDEQEESMAPGNIAGERSFQPRKRGPGAFQPPEVYDQNTAKVSTKRDVWSFGCILMMVLAFALGGPQEVEEQRRKRAVGGDDYFYRRTSQGAKLKKGIQNWLKQTAESQDEVHSQWVGPCVKLIVEVLQGNVFQRPEINMVITPLEGILATTERFANDRLWIFEEQRRPSHASVLVAQNVVLDRPSDTAPQSIGLTTPPPTPVSHSSSSPVRRPTDSTRSSASWLSPSSAYDPSLQYGRLEVPRKSDCRGAALDPSGGSAALWSLTDVVIYALSEDLRLQETLPGAFIDVCDDAKAFVRFPEHNECLHVRMCGQWFAIISRSRKSQHELTTYFRPRMQQARHEQRKKIDLDREPQDLTISKQGAVALRDLNKIILHTPNWSSTFRLGKDYAGMAFSGNGEYFCLWERDGGRDNMHYWTIWNIENGEIVGNTIYQAFKYSSQPHSRKPLLLPFMAWPRFIACDHQQNLYLIRGDAETERVHSMRPTDNATAGIVLPDDEAFVIIRSLSSMKSSTVHKGSLSFVDEPFYDLRSCGKLSHQIDLRHEAIATRNYEPGAGSPSLLVLSRSGKLVCKML